MISIEKQHCIDAKSKLGDLNRSIFKLKIHILENRDFYFQQDTEKILELIKSIQGKELAILKEVQMIYDEFENW